MIDRERRSRLNMLVVHIGGNTHDAARCGADVDELHYRVGPHDVAIDGILTGEHALRRALADDDHRLAAAPVVVVEITAGDEWHPQRREESRRHHPKSRQRVFFVIAFYVALPAELEAGTLIAGVAPGNIRTQSDTIHPGQ